MTDNKSTNGETLASQTYRQLRSDIVTGTLKPGEKLRIEPLKKIYNVGGSPIREALNRLSREQLVLQHDQIGFRVAPVGLGDLMELTNTRCMLNEVAVREAIKNGSSLWEEGVLLSHYRMIKARRCQNFGEKINKEWETAHYEFHSSIISGCNSKWIIEFTKMLYDAFDRYRYLIPNSEKIERDVDLEHESILNAVVGRDGDLAIALLNEHIRTTAQQIMKSAHGQLVEG